MGLPGRTVSHGRSSGLRIPISSSGNRVKPQRGLPGALPGGLPGSSGGVPGCSPVVKFTTRFFCKRLPCVYFGFSIIFESFAYRAQNMDPTYTYIAGRFAKATLKRFTGKTHWGPIVSKMMELYVFHYF